VQTQKSIILSSETVLFSMPPVWSSPGKMALLYWVCNFRIHHHLPRACSAKIVHPGVWGRLVDDPVIWLCVQNLRRNDHVRRRVYISRSTEINDWWPIVLGRGYASTCVCLCTVTDDQQVVSSNLNRFSSALLTIYNSMYIIQDVSEHCLWTTNTVGWHNL
jgi:hypothetical protein